MTPACQLNITSETLSAWYSHLLSPAEQDRLAQHLDTCPACQNVVNHYQRIAQSVRTPPMMPSQESIWRGVRTRLNTPGGNMHTPPRMWALGGLGAAVSLIAIFALVLSHLPVKSRPTVAASTATPTSTQGIATPTSSPWEEYGHYGQLGSTQVSLANPDIAYRFAPSQTLKQGSIPIGIQVTTDAGQNWTGHPLPDGLDPQTAGFVLNPLNPAVVYLQGLLTNAATCMPLASPMHHVGPSAPTVSNAGYHCYGQLISTDYGATWQPLMMPFSGVMSSGYETNDRVATIKQQGSQLFSMINAELQGGASPPKGHLIKSEDGGLTWHLADTTLPSTVGIVTYATSPNGAAVFAITEQEAAFNRSGADGPFTPDLKLWRLAATGTWTLVSTLPFHQLPVVGASPLIASWPTPSTPILYADAVGTSSSASWFKVFSADGGKTWAFVPTQGLPDSSSIPVVGSFMSTFLDGSVILSKQVSNGNSLPALFQWSPTHPTWQQITPPLPQNATGFVAIRIVTSASGGTQRNVLALYSTSDGEKLATYELQPVTTP